MARTISVAVSWFSARVARARLGDGEMLMTPLSSCRRAPAEVPAILPNTAPGHQAGAAGIVEIEQPADQFAGGIEAADRLVVGVEHLGVGVDAQPAERESDAAGHRVALERRLIDGVRPIALVDGEPLGAPAILDVGIERNVGSHRRVVFGDGLEELLRVHAFELLRELLDRVGRRPW